MQATLEMLPLLALILIGAKLAGLLSQRFGMPAVFGELLLGLVLGPSLLNIVAPDEALHLLGQIGMTILGAAVIDDVLGVVVLSVVLALAGEGVFWLTMLKMVVFLPVVGGAGLARRRNTQLSRGGIPAPAYVGAVKMNTAKPAIDAAL